MSNDRIATHAPPAPTANRRNRGNGRPLPGDDPTASHHDDPPPRAHDQPAMEDESPCPPATQRRICDSELPDTLLHPDEPEAMTIDELMLRLHNGEVRPHDLSADLRRECVHQLTLDGYSSSQIAQLMHITERTVRRDRAAARKLTSVQPADTLGDEMLGHYQAVTLRSIQRLSRLANDESAAPGVRVWAEQTIVRNYDRLLRTARQLGYITDGSKRIVRSLEEKEAMWRRQAKETDAFLPTILGRGKQA